MGERVRMAYVREVSDPEQLDHVEAALEQWCEDEADGATVSMRISFNAGRGKARWLPRGFANIAEAGPRLVLGLVAELRREQRRRAELAAAADALAKAVEEVDISALNKVLAAYRMVTRG